MKPTKEDISAKYFYADNGYLCYLNDSGRHARYKAGSRAGSTSKEGVRVILLDGKYYQEHQLVWCLKSGIWPDASVRHINGNLLDNRIENLQVDFPEFKNRNELPSVDTLRQMLDYCPNTGIIRWKVRRKNISMPGDEAGVVSGSGYIKIGINRKQLRAHRIAWAMTYGSWPDHDIDHKNRVRTDNRLENLRPATRSQNSQNSSLRSDNTSGTKGVHVRKDNGRFSASITLDGESKYLGCYHSFQAAQLARAQAEAALHPYRASLTQEDSPYDA